MMKYFVVLIVLLSSCSDDPEKYFVSHERKEWPYFSKLAVEPDSVTWGSLQLGVGNDRLISAPGPTDHYVQAVLYYNDSTMKELMTLVDTASSESYNLTLDPANFQDWFPPEVKSMFRRNGAQYISIDKCFSLQPDEAWRTSCLLADRNILFLTYTTN